MLIVYLISEKISPTEGRTISDGNLGIPKRLWKHIVSWVFKVILFTYFWKLSIEWKSKALKSWVDIMFWNVLDGLVAVDFIIVIFVLVVFVIAHCHNMYDIIPQGATAVEALISSSAIFQEGSSEDWWCYLFFQSWDYQMAG